jgi:TolB protein
MFGGKRTNPQIWVTDATGREIRQITSDAGTNVDPSWSPDGSRIALLTQTSPASGDRFVGIWNIRVVDSGGGPTELVTNDDHVNSMPKWIDDKSIIFHRFEYGLDTGFDIWTVNVDGSKFEPFLVTGADEEYADP